MLTFLGCAVSSMLCAGRFGLSGYSRGGLLMPVVGIACAAYYRVYAGDVSFVLLGALVAGIAIGFVAMYLASMMI